MPDFTCLQRDDVPFTHWVGDTFLPMDAVRAINAAWPGDVANDERWLHERRDYASKSALMFPHTLPPLPQALAEFLYAPEQVALLSTLTGLALMPDPWFTDGPTVPRVGGGLHEIHRGGALGMHVDFSAHPTGLTRALNLLLYLNVEWRDGWGGALRLGLGADAKLIYPRGGTVVIFETNGESWHGHPDPLMCPAHVTRRSLALYYYRASDVPPDRPTTVYHSVAAKLAKAKRRK